MKKVRTCTSVAISPSLILLCAGALGAGMLGCGGSSDTTTRQWLRPPAPPTSSPRLSPSQRMTTLCPDQEESAHPTASSASRTALYEHLTYVAYPVDANYQSLDVAVPVKVDGTDIDAANAPILFDIRWMTIWRLLSESQRTRLTTQRHKHYRRAPRPPRS